MDSPAPAFGPVLYLRGATDDTWRVRAVIGLRERERPAALEAEGSHHEASRLDSRLGLNLWRYDFALPRGREAHTHRYRIGTSDWPVETPGEDRLRLAFTACNGREDAELDRPENFPARNLLWRQIATVHAKTPFHLLLQGGDQFYADLVWRKVPALEQLKRRRRFRERGEKPAEGDLPPVDDYYFRGYCKLWSQPELAAVLARVPSLMMWDDHDIFDGWGSHPEVWQSSPAYQAVFAAARQNFQLFQLGRAGDNDAVNAYAARARHFGWCVRIGNVGLVAPDLRSARTMQRVMSAEVWADFEEALAGLEGCRTLLLISTVPLVNIELPHLERLLWVVPGQHVRHNDLRDQWQSPAHREEWLRMLTLLFGFAARNEATVVSLSGEIHLAALGRAWSERAEIHQLISSGVVHPAPPKVLALGLDLLTRGKRQIDHKAHYEMLPLPGVGRRYLAERNWLELEVHPEAAVRVRWHAEQAGPLPWLDLRPQTSAAAKS